VRACKRNYHDQVNGPVRNIQKVVFDLREQRRVLQTSRQKLFTVTMEPLLRQKAEEERKVAAVSVGSGLSLGFGNAKKEEAADKSKEDIADGKSAVSKAVEVVSVKMLSQKYKMEETFVEDLYRDFMKHSDPTTESIGKKEFLVFLQHVCPGRTLVESDTDAWWGQIVTIVKAKPQGAEDPAKAGRKQKVVCPFDDFIAWYAHSEARTQ